MALSLRTKQFVAAVLTTLHETGGGPETMLYLGLKCPLDEWNSLKFMLVQAGYITVSPIHWVTLEPAGADLAIRINATLDAAKQVAGMLKGKSAEGQHESV